MKNFFTILFTVLSISAAIGQNNPLIIPKAISLPKDSLEAGKLILSLTNLLVAKEKPNEENTFVYEKENVETYILLDEINGIEKSGKNKDDYFFKPYLTNVVKLNDTEYYTQLSYIGISENIPVLRASFELIAHKENDEFKFSSPLTRNSSSWETKKIGTCTFHYKTRLNEKTATNFAKSAELFDTKLNSKIKQTDIYLTEDFPELLKMIGAQYKLDYNGRVKSTFTSTSRNRALIVKGNQDSSFEDFDLHDLWHDRLSLVIPRSLVNKPIDEGCAYLYGGSWGISWKEIYKAFKEQITTNKNTNWAEIKETPVTFKTKEYPNSADYIINALLLKKIEKEEGFAGVWEFLNCGKFEKGNENYYKILEKLTGITKVNYNEKVWELINNEK